MTDDTERKLSCHLSASNQKQAKDSDTEGTEAQTMAGKVIGLGSHFGRLLIHDYIWLSIIKLLSNEGQ